MSYFIDKGGKVYRYEVAPGARILLEDGRYIWETPEVERRLFSTHPDVNPFLERIEDGTWTYMGELID